jgi:hypothetical protein
MVSGRWFSEKCIGSTPHPKPFRCSSPGAIYHLRSTRYPACFITRCSGPSVFSCVPFCVSVDGSFVFGRQLKIYPQNHRTRQRPQRTRAPRFGSETDRLQISGPNSEGAPSERLGPECIDGPRLLHNSVPKTGGSCCRAPEFGALVILCTRLRSVFLWMALWTGGGGGAKESPGSGRNRGFRRSSDIQTTCRDS